MRAVSNTYHSATGVTHAPIRPDIARPVSPPNRGDAALGGALREALNIPLSYAVERPRGELAPTANQPNLYRDGRGGQFIHDGTNWFPVRHDVDNGTLRVWQPGNTAKPQYPVRTNAGGNFEVHHDVGLKGGAPIKNKWDSPFGSSDSPFGGSGGASGSSASPFGASGGSSLENRHKLSRQLSELSSIHQPGSYANTVNVVNHGLQRLNVGLSDQSFGHVSNNLHRVENGQMTNAEASSSEYRTFMNDVCRGDGSPTDKNWALFGAALNRVAGVPYHAETDITNMHLNRNQDPLTRLNMQAFVQNDWKG
nr:hypothetical protein HUO10_002260 [Paraburkholderia busanensis]